MRSTLMIAFLIQVSYLCLAQISTREIAEVIEYNKPDIFDSLRVENNDINQYIGQEVYILPFSKASVDQSYAGFYNTPITNSDNPYILNYDDFRNVKLLIIDAEYTTRYKQWYFKLLCEQSDTLVYVAPYEVYEYSFYGAPFIFNSFIEKSKQIYLNTSFTVKRDFSTADINTGEIVELEENEKWNCVAVTLIDIDSKDFNYAQQPKYYIPALILKDSDNHEIFMNYQQEYYNEFDDALVFHPNIRPSINDFYTEDEFQSVLIEEEAKLKLEREREINAEKQKQTILSKYGDYYGSLINQNKVVIEMTKEMCQYSWGKPLSVDVLTLESIVYEVWQYNYKTFLYLEDGILKIIKH